MTRDGQTADGEPGLAGRLILWRHPRPDDRRVAGRCIGRTDLPADPRRARRLARRITRWARRHDWRDRTIWTAPLARGAVVGRLLRRQGWCHRIDARLAELDFGQWDGEPWSTIAVAEIDAWCQDLLRHPPGGGETVAGLAGRVRAFCRQRLDDGPGVLVVGHGGWIRLARALGDNEIVDATTWGQRLIAHGRRLELDLAAIAAATDWPNLLSDES